MEEEEGHLQDGFEEIGDGGARTDRIAMGPVDGAHV